MLLQFVLHFSLFVQFDFRSFIVQLFIWCGDSGHCRPGSDAQFGIRDGMGSKGWDGEGSTGWCGREGWARLGGKQGTGTDAADCAVMGESLEPILDLR